MTRATNWHERFNNSDGLELAYQWLPGAGPGVVFCSGFNSDMEGTKAQALAQWCQDHQRQYTRFDYRGHGRSGGAFTEGTIGGWLLDTLAVVDQITEGPQILVGSSMGGWLALLAALARPDRVVGFLGIAPAPDFTERLFSDRLDEAQRAALESNGCCELPSDYDAAPYLITQHLFEEAREHFLLTGPIALNIPVRVIHGQCDDAVPWQSSVQLMQHLQSQDAELLLVKHGDHRLSEPRDIERMQQTLAGLIDRAGTTLQSAGRERQK